jgi:hypothetical protein
VKRRNFLKTGSTVAAMSAIGGTSIISGCRIAESSKSVLKPTGFDPIDMCENHPARNVQWGLEPVPQPLGFFGPPQADVSYDYKQCDMRHLHYRYTYSAPRGGIETRLEITDVVIYLRLRKTDNQLFCAMSLRWWCGHRTQRAFPFTVRLNDAQGIPLTFIEIPPFIIDCQGVGLPGALYEPPFVAIGTPQDAYFRTVASSELLLPATLDGDHGPCCR